MSHQLVKVISEKMEIDLQDKKCEYISYRFFMILRLQEIEQKYRNNINSDDCFSKDIRTALAILIMDSLKLSLTINDISYIVVYLLIIINENKL